MPWPVTVLAWRQIGLRPPIVPGPGVATPPRGPWGRRRPRPDPMRRWPLRPPPTGAYAPPRVATGCPASAPPATGHLPVGLRSTPHRPDGHLRTGDERRSAHRMPDHPSRHHPPPSPRCCAYRGSRRSPHAAALPDRCRGIRRRSPRPRTGPPLDRRPVGRGPGELRQGRARRSPVGRCRPLAERQAHRPPLGDVAYAFQLVPLPSKLGLSAGGARCGGWGRGSRRSGRGWCWGRRRRR